jgi:hypothetical protein
MYCEWNISVLAQAVPQQFKRSIQGNAKPQAADIT